jgi:hypothetical protein
MERILKKLTKKEIKERDKQCEVDLEKQPCPLCSQNEIKLGFETLKTLTKSDLIKIIQSKNELLVQYVDWVNELKSEKERESK